MNLCTDQLLMLVAQPEQILSVSELSRDRYLSMMHRESSHFPANKGRAEEVYLYKPDLVLAGSYTSHASVSMLQNLGITVELFSPLGSLADIPKAIERVGELVGQTEKAKELNAAFEQALKVAQQGDQRDEVRAATFYARRYTAGSGTLVHDTMEKSGLKNVAAELGLKGTQSMPLEMLVMEAPPVLVVGAPVSEGEALAFEVLSHPAFDRTTAKDGLVIMKDRYTICGLPYISAAVEMLKKAGDKVATAAKGNS
nr:ABC transporter substrate-binding protein [Pseudovibrio flavus]